MQRGVRVFRAFLTVMNEHAVNKETAMGQNEAGRRDHWLLMRPLLL